MAKRRSTRAEIIEREQQQAEIVAELILLGADDVAGQVLRCWHGKIFGDPTRHRERCRSVCCLSCRRPPLAAWWRSFLTWCQDGGATSYFRLAIVDPLVEGPTVAKSLRNLRDRAARESGLWDQVAYLGVADGEYLHVLVSHPGLGREQVQRRLRVLRLQMVLADIPSAPAFVLSPQVLALLGSLRRGLQPTRFMVLPRRCR